MNTTYPRVRPLALVLGIGTPLARALVAALATRDTDLLLVDADGEGLLALRESLGSVMVHVQLFQADLARNAGRQDLLRFLSLAGAKPDLLLFLAAESLEEKALAAPLPQARRVLEANFSALDELLRSGILAHMLHEDNGYILLAMPRPMPGALGGHALQAASCAALQQYGLALREELQGSGVGLTLALCPPVALAPGSTATAPQRVLAERLLRSLFARQAQAQAGGWWTGLAAPLRWGGRRMRGRR
ncbi:MAG: SDR family NAD(P)-dependent oxidoreductase [Candidatus Delongbacteria bacterium]